MRIWKMLTTRVIREAIDDDVSEAAESTVPKALPGSSGGYRSRSSARLQQLRLRVAQLNRCEFTMHCPQGARHVRIQKTDRHPEPIVTGQDGAIVLL